MIRNKEKPGLHREKHTTTYITKTTMLWVYHNAKHHHQRRRTKTTTMLPTNVSLLALLLVVVVVDVWNQHHHHHHHGPVFMMEAFLLFPQQQQQHHKQPRSSSSTKSTVFIDTTTTTTNSRSVTSKPVGFGGAAGQDQMSSKKSIRSSKQQLLVMKLSQQGSTGEGQQQQDSDDDDDDEEEDDPFDFIRKYNQNKKSAERLRKRDVLRDWLVNSGISTNSSTSRRSSGSSSSSKTMVRPIRMEDGSIIDPPPSEPNRVQAKFDSLFKGMPSIMDILGGDDDDGDVGGGVVGGNIGLGQVSGGSSSKSRAEKEKESTSSRSTASVSKNDDDDSWFDKERKEIEDKYEEIWQEISSQLQQDRAQDPESVPENAEGVMKTVLLQEMQAEIDQTRDERARQRLDLYQEELLLNFDSRDDDSEAGDVDETVQKLIQDSEEEYEKWENSRIQLDEFIQYEQDAFQRALSAPPVDNNIAVPEIGEDLDQWALDRLRDMASARQPQQQPTDTEDENNMDDDDKIVLSILEDNIEDLESKMTKQSERRTTTNMVDEMSSQEWQMYRSIATRLDKEDMTTNKDTTITSDDDKEARIADRLQSWKEFQQKEETNRKEAGLARGPRLPFEWQEVSSESLDTTITQVSSGDDDNGGDVRQRSRADIRRDINRQAVQALEDLVKNGGGSVRTDSLKRDLDALKAQLALHDYLDVDESELLEEEEMKPNVAGPVDLSSVFSSRYEEDIDKNVDTKPTTESLASSQADTFVSPKPTTPFFQSDDYQPPPPQTPFFDDDDDIAAITENALVDDSKLGSLEEQKLRAMFRRANAQTAEEQQNIRKQWEEYQEIERTIRAQSGLGVGDDQDLGLADIKVNISDVMMKDGDIDAEQVLAAIGPRPKRSKSIISGTPTSIEQPTSKSRLTRTEPDPDEISEALFRAVAATGGGITRDDPIEKQKEKVAYEEFRQKENELRQRLDQVEEDVANIDLPTTTESVDDVEYANKVLESLGPRPVPKRKRAVDMENFSDNGGILSKVEDDDDDEDDDDENEDEFLETSATGDLENIPNWLKKDREEARKKGSNEDGRVTRTDIDDAFEDDEYEKNMRQLAEYERRRSANRKRSSPGIDISDLFLNRDETDDYRDYGFDDFYSKGKTRGSTFSSFETRKANLLDYTELTVQELNLLMDNRESVHATGVSQYLPRINKPFKEFGAIFRLEGVLVDITGFQFEAYKRIAEKYGFRQPDIEDVRRAAVTRSDFAIREIFYWTDDITLCREAATMHREVLREVIAEWIDKMGLQSNPVSTDTTEFLSDDTIESQANQQHSGDAALQKSPGNEGDLLRWMLKAWSHTAKQYGFQPPSIESIMSAASLGPDVAVRAFRWSKDASEIDRIVSSYRRYLETLQAGKELVDSGRNGDENVVTETIDKSRYEPNDRDRMMEIVYAAWKKTATDKGFEAPTPEEVMAAFVINDPFLVVRDGFGWEQDRSAVSDIVVAYQNNLADLMNEQDSGQTITSPTVAPAELPASQEHKASPQPAAGPTDEEILEMYVYAWTVTAEKHGFDSPGLEQIQLASKTDSSEAIKRLFGWEKEDEKVKEISNTFNAAMKKVSEKYIQKYKLKADASTGPQTTTSQSTVPSKQTPSDDEVFQAAFDSWTAVARKFGYQLPDYEQVQFAMTVGPDEAILVGFEWTSDPLEAEKIATAYRDAIKTRRSKWQSSGNRVSSPSLVKPTTPEKEDVIPPCQVVPGAAKWVKSLLDNEMQCGVMSYLDRDQVDVLLEFAGLSSLFGRDKRVTRSSGYNRERQQMLGVALRIERRPDHCVVFDASPYAAAEAHDVEMKNVAMIGNYPRYELLASDLTASSCDELTALNLRRLFGERVDDQPMFDMQQAQPESRKKIRTRFWEEGDRI